MQEGTPTPILESEYTQVLRQQGASANLWRTVSFVLGLIIAGGTVLSVMGKAFYVTRGEYTEKAKTDAVELASLHAAVDSIKSTLHDQEVAFKTLTETVYNLPRGDVRDTRRPR